MKRSSLVRTSRTDRSRVFNLARPYRGRIVVLSLLSFLNGVSEAIFLVIATRIALAIADEKHLTDVIAGLSMSINVGLIVALLLIVARLALAMGSTVISSSLSAAVNIDLRRELAESFLATNWATQQNEPSGRLLQILTAFVPQAMEAISSLTSTIGTLLNLAAMVAISVFIDPIASAIVFLALVTLGSLLAPIRHQIKVRARASAQAQTTYAELVSELGEMGLEMQAFGVNRKFAGRVHELSRKVARTSQQVYFLRGIAPQLFTSMVFSAVVLGLVVASSSGVRQLSSVGPVMLIMLRSLGFGQQLQTAAVQLASSIPFLEVLEATRIRYREASATRGEVPIDVANSIQVNELSFSYSEGRSALKDISFVIHPGEIIGIIGPSGAGKSTLVQILLGIRDPTSGRIEIGGVSLSDIDRTSWTDQVAFVPQEPRLFTGTVADNVRFFRDTVTNVEVEEAIQLANIADDVGALPQGVDTHIGHRGVQLSGGQRQRISIARALAGHPKLIVLDEPTSALDVHSEAMIRKTVSDLRGEVTVVVIAHRLSTLEMCDRLMVIEGGALIAFDTPKSLRSDNEFYRQALKLSGLA